MNEITKSKLINFYNKIALNLFGAAIETISRIDENVKNELKSFNENFSLSISADLNSKPITLKRKKDFLKFVDGENQNANIKIYFKSNSAAFKIFSGMKSVNQAYLENRLIVEGDINNTLPLVRSINIVENYLFPKFISKKILPEYESKKIGLTKTYLKILKRFWSK